MHIKEINIKNRICNYHFDKLVKTKNVEAKNTLINKKDNLMIYFNRYGHSKSIKILIVHHHELMGKSKEHEGKKHLMVNGFMLDKSLDKIKKTIGIVKFDDTMILIDMDDKFPEYITL